MAINQYNGGVILDTLIVWLTNEYLQNQGLKNFILDWVVNIIGYSTLFLLGIRMRYATLKQKRFYLISLSLLVVATLVYYLCSKGLPIRISPTYKYPPQSYYLIYGLFVCCGLWCTRKYFYHFLENKLFLFIGQNTIWIYLYHIPLLMVTSFLPFGWIGKYVAVFSVAVVMTYIQSLVADRFISKFAFLKYLKG